VSAQRRKVVFVELNEITWRFIDPFVKEGLLPTFADILKRGARATPMAPEISPDLDPWISWNTVYTGRPASEHGVKFLEQPPETVHGPKIWDLVADANRSLGIYGSIMSWPPRNDVKGFWIPGTFSPGPETFPADLQPIQDMNLKYTRAHTPLANGVKTSKFEMLKQLRKLGLKASTLATVAKFFARKAVGLAKEWEKVSLQPLINLDFFEALWRKHQPDFSTFHSNHVAHYQHRFWRSTDPAPFLEKPSAEEVKQFGGAIRFGYRSADDLLRRIVRMVTPDTVVVVASGLGQKPYVVEEFRDGRSVVRLQNIEQVLDLLGIAGKCRPYSVMAPQWNIQFDDAEVQRKAVEGFAASYLGSPGNKLFHCEEVGNTLCVNIYQKVPRPVNWDADCVFPTTNRTIKMRDLCAEKDSTPKQGYHDQTGMLMMAGPGIRVGANAEACTTLDLAPTLLTILGIPVPGHMKGRVLDELLEPSVRSYRANLSESPATTPVSV
jgi:hypothetical protein